MTHTYTPPFFSSTFTHYPLLTAHYPLLTAHYSLPTTHYPLLTTHYLLQRLCLWLHLCNRPQPQSLRLQGRWVTFSCFHTVFILCLCCYRVVFMMLSSCIYDAIELSSWCYHTVFMMLSCCLYDVIVLLSWYYRDVFMMLSWCLHDVIVMYSWCYRAVIMILSCCLYDVIVLLSHSHCYSHCYTHIHSDSIGTGSLSVTGATTVGYPHTSTHSALCSRSLSLSLTHSLTHSHKQWFSNQREYTYRLPRCRRRRHQCVRTHLTLRGVQEQCRNICFQSNSNRSEFVSLELHDCLRISSGSE